MTEAVQLNMKQALDLRAVTNTTKIHALEHATIAVLESQFKRSRISGLSIPFGFILFGSCGIEEVRDAFEIARARLAAGETALAISKNCGTNIVVAGSMMTLAAMAVFSGTKNTKERIARFDLAMITLGLLSRYIRGAGNYVQKNFTTNPDVADLTADGIYSTTILGQEAVFVRIVSQEG